MGAATERLFRCTSCDGMGSSYVRHLIDRRVVQLGTPTFLGADRNPEPTVRSRKPRIIESVPTAKVRLRSTNGCKASVTSRVHRLDVVCVAEAIQISSLHSFAFIGAASAMKGAFIHDTNNLTLH